MTRVAIMGATGAVGRELLATLERRGFPCSSIKALASERSAGRRVEFRGAPIEIEVLNEGSFDDVDLVLASAGGSVSKQFAPIAVRAGAVVIDNTSAFRMAPDVPLVVPEVNADAVESHRGLIANPNCSTIQMVVALAPIHRAVGIERIVVSTYQAASGAGQAAMDEMIAHTRETLEGRAPERSEKFAHPVAFNCLPHIDVFMDNGYTREEMKMVHETRKILGDETIRVTATCVRVPVMRSHSEAINIQTREKMTADEARRLLAGAPGVVVLDDPGAKVYPMPREAAHRDAVYVGRIREDESIERGLNLWVVADQLLKGAALNAVQIAEILLARDRLSVRV